MGKKEWIMPTHIVAAAGVVENEAGEILLVNTYNGGWVFPGGQVEVGENIIDAVKREILEESGIEAEVGELFCISSNTSKHPGYGGIKEVPTKVMLDFICRKTGGEIRGSEENSESAWIRKDTALSMIQAPAIRERYQAYLEYSGRPCCLEYVTHPVYELKLKRTV